MDEDGSFQAGLIGGKKIGLFSGSRSKGGSDAKPRLTALRRALKTSTDEGASLADDLLQTGDGSQFYSGSVIQRYTASWMLVHYLLHGRDGMHADAFARYLGAEAEGRGDSALFAETIGLSAGELDAALLQHIDQLKLR